MHKFDVDIDVNKNVERSDYGKRVPIVNLDKQKMLPHPSGIVIDDIPIDPESGYVPFDYKSLEDVGVIKVDILNNHSYDIFESKAELLDYQNRLDEVDWGWFEDKSFTEQLPHLKGNFHYIDHIRPKSVEELAALLALIRPGKMHLIDTYALTDAQLYKRPTNGKMYMKKSHAIAYAVMICVVALKMKSGVNHFGVS